ncbi:MAG TPA: DNA methyltransferase [Anaerolineae bacterium]|nr:DNA methyltransferase [Anaerolineae bacterium]HUW13365.1 DNA methyltransferase [Anaerolineae bacterium]
MVDSLGPYALGPGGECEGIYIGDARELAKAIPDESVDLIFTDPPYMREYLPLYGWLGDAAARILKPDGFLLAYAGIFHKQAIMEFLGRSLDYFWDFVAYGRNGPGSMVWARKVVSKAKSILTYTKPGQTPRPRCSVLGVWVGSGQDKRFHVWGQDESTARYYIDCFSHVGDVLVDPFCGGGTAPAMCKVLRRKCLAFEIEPDVGLSARERVRATSMLLPGLGFDQMELACNGGGEP